MQPSILVTGGAGFIGSCYVRAERRAGRFRVVNLDKLTYSGNLDNLDVLRGDPDHHFVHGDIGDRDLIRGLLAAHRPAAVVNFAAESHVDRSIHDPQPFIRTNVDATCALLAEVTAWLRDLPETERVAFRFLHISTDEVYGSLHPDDPPFTERTAYAPNSPYSASKAASDHFVRAFHHTYGLPALITNCSNNYGPFQFPEKLIPLMILNALERKPLPVYGKGENIRDWLHVEDHCAAVSLVLEKGVPGETYAIGGRAERKNIDIVHAICAALDAEAPHPAGPYAALIQFVTDRPGHDLRYAIDCGRIERELGWKQNHTFEQGLLDTVRWYLANPEWAARVRSGKYRNWLAINYTERGGL